MSSVLFSPLALRGVELANRVVVAPMCQYAAVDGSANDWHLMHLGQYAMGAAGLVFTEATHVSAVGRISPKCLGLYSDANQAALKRVIDFCHEHGVTPMAIQLAHAGRKGSNRPPQEGGTPIPPDTADGWQRVGPSAEPYADWPVPHALSLEEIAEVKRQFVDAARRAVAIGIEVAELHAAHGYLMHEFLSPNSNRRNDAYGGGRENRMRLLLEVFEAVRAVWPQDRPVGVRVSATEWVDGGWDLDDTLVLAHELQALGCDFLDVSSGGNDPKQQLQAGPGYQVPFAEAVKRATGMAAMAVGMITKARQAEEIVASGKADMVALARGMMFDPRWAWHAAEELGAETPYAERYLRAHPSRWPQVFPWRQAAE